MSNDGQSGPYSGGGGEVKRWLVRPVAWEEGGGGGVSGRSNDDQSGPYPGGGCQGGKTLASQARTLGEGGGVSGRSNDDQSGPYPGGGGVREFKRWPLKPDSGGDVREVKRWPIKPIPGGGVFREVVRPVPWEGGVKR